MALTVPNPVPARTLYNTAKRVVDELGKGQEMLRTAGEGCTTATGNNWFVILVPDVDIIVVGARMTCGGTALTADTAEVTVPANGEDITQAAGAGNRLVDQVADPATAEDTVLDLTLANLNANRVQAGQPIVGLYNDAAGSGVIVHVQVYYILADEERTY